MTVKILTSVNLTATKEIKHVLQTKAFRENHLTSIKQYTGFWLYWQNWVHLRHSSGSSEPSPQSSTVSHFHQNGIHLSVLQRNCKKERKKKDFLNTFFFSKRKPKTTNYEKLSDCGVVPLIVKYFYFITPIQLFFFFWRCSALWLQLIEVTIVLMTLVHSLELHW